MNRKTLTLDDMFNEVEAQNAERTARELAEEQAAWDRLSPEEQQRRLTIAQQKFESMFDFEESEDEESDDSDEEE